MLQSAKMASKTTQKQSTAEIACMLKAVRFAVETKHAELLVLASAVEALERKLVIAQDQDKAEQAVRVVSTVKHYLHCFSCNSWREARSRTAGHFQFIK
jgi:hypothetical protein